MAVCNKENRQENDATGTLRTRRIDEVPSSISIESPSIIVITLISVGLYGAMCAGIVAKVAGAWEGDG